MVPDRSAASLTKLRADAIALFREGVAAADPGQAVADALEQRKAAIAAASRVILVAFGKAACPMARAALPFVKDRLAAACVLTNHENVVDIDGVEVIGGGHPIPDAGSIAGARKIEDAVRSARPDDLVLVLVSGGGSALLCAPAEGLDLSDKIALNDALIRCGADIGEINSVRRLFSRLKGGRLARLAPQSRMVSLILSDVPGDDLATIASGPTARPLVGAQQAAAVLQRYDLLAGLPQAMRAHLDRQRDRDEMDPSAFDHVENLVIGSNRLSLQKMMGKARAISPTVMHVDEWLEGDVSAVAERLHNLASDAAGQTGPIVVVSGGEPTVKVTGTGKGGRNQELALRFALLNEQKPIDRAWVFLSGGTDGRDGPTDAAGAVVDAGSPALMRQQGCDPIAHLANNDAYHALASSGDLLITGATGTNVADIQIVLMQ
ncbi:glycerate kinase type-2 family protein [Pseudaminobacter sp. NGMCC 1.201702]|uniref:glycerate kinase type-2 family protein n=1 Tax=Pseudaminobacter sp. NGMCC 1.201702 TaxID=3391825 RepID=UPI0039EFCBFD